MKKFRNWIAKKILRVELKEFDYFHESLLKLVAEIVQKKGAFGKQIYHTQAGRVEVTVKLL